MGPVSFESLYAGEDRQQAVEVARRLTEAGIKVVSTQRDETSGVETYRIVISTADGARARSLLNDRPESILVEPLSGPPDVEVELPGSKSHTNRALMCAGLAKGQSVLDGVLFANDTKAMLGALTQLGAQVDADSGGCQVSVVGCDGELRTGPLVVNCAQSGTTSRFVTAMVALGHGNYVVDGEPPLRARPMAPLVRALESLGAGFDGENVPLGVSASGLTAGVTEISGSVSSQFLSGILMAAPYATADGDGPSVVEIRLTDDLISKPYVDLTLATMATFGVEVVNHGYERFEVGQARYQGSSVVIEPDASAASYFFAAAAITGGRVRVAGLGANSLQGDMAFVSALAQMGAEVRQGDNWTEVRGTGSLNGIEIDMADISDTAQTLAIVATFATTPTTVTGIGFIRYKETDRLQAVVTELNRRGMDARVDDDGFTIWPGTPSPGEIESYDDHRMAMSFALLGLVHPGIVIMDPGCTAKTFPTYFDVLERLRPS